MNQQMTVGAPPKKKFNKGLGCTIGCVGVIILLILALVGIFFFVRAQMDTVVQRYTSDSPVTIQAPQVTDPEISRAIAMYDDFMAQLKAGKPLPELKLSSNDINALLYNHPDFAEFKDSVKVAIEDNLIRSTVSLDASAIGLADAIPLVGGFLEGRFINGDAVLEIALENNLATLKLRDLIIDGEPAAETFVTALGSENLLQDVNSPEFDQILNKLESIRVDEGVITITPRESLQLVE